GEEKVMMAFPPPVPMKILGKDMTGHIIVFDFLFGVIVLALWSLGRQLSLRHFSSLDIWLARVRRLGLGLSWFFLSTLGISLWYLALFSHHSLTRPNDNMLLLMPFDILFVVSSAFIIQTLGQRIWIVLMSARIMCILIYFASLTFSE